MKKFMVGLFALLVAFLIQKYLFQQFKETKLSRQLIANLSISTGMSFHPSKTVIKNTGDLILENLEITPNDFSFPLVRINNFSSNADVLKKGEINYTNNHIKGLQFPFITERRDLSLQNYNNLVQVFIDEDQIRKNLSTRISNQLKAFIFEYEKLIKYFKQGIRTGSIYEDKLKKTKAYLKREVSFKMKTPPLKSDFNNQALFKEILRPTIENIINSYGQLLYQVKEAQQKLLFRDKKIKQGILFEKLLFIEESGLVGKVEGIGTLNLTTSPSLKARIQGDFKSKGIKGVNFEAHINKGKETAIVSKLNIAELPLHYKSMDVLISLQSMAFTINQQINTHFNIELKNIKLTEKDKYKDERLELLTKLLSPKNITIDITSKSFDPKKAVTLEAMNIKITDLSKEDLSKKLAPFLQEHFKKLIVAEEKSSERYQRFLYLRGQLESLIKDPLPKEEAPQ